jgi:predicted MFS family arabinose efflux permease
VSGAATRGLAPLRRRGFRFLAAGQLASNLGDAFYAVALPWYVLSEHGGPLLLGTVLTAYGVPRTALLAVGGHASDRWRPWTVMMSTDAVRALGVGALAVAAATGPARAAVLVPIAAVLGAGEGLFLPGSFSIVPTLLPGEELQAGNALAAAGTQLAALAGPAIGGALVALFGPAPAFSVDAGSFVVSAATLCCVRAAASPDPAGVTPAAAGRARRSAGDVRAAGQTDRASEQTDRASEQTDRATEHGKPAVLALLRSERILQLALLITIAANLGSAGMDQVALPSLAHGPLHASAAGFGGLVAAFGAGALLGTLAAGQAARARRPAVAASMAFFAEALFIAVVPYLGGTLPAGAALAALGVLNGFGNVVMLTVFQRWAPPELLGRLNGVLLTASFGVFPVSVAIAALVVHGLGPAPFFPLAAVTVAVPLLFGLSQRTWRDFGMAGQPPSGLAEGARPVPVAADTLARTS